MGFFYAKITHIEIINGNLVCVLPLVVPAFHVSIVDEYTELWVTVKL